MRPNWGNLFWETLIHCGAMEALSSCQCSVALSPILLLKLFISQNIVSLFRSMCETGAKIFSYRELCLPLKPSKKEVIQRKCRSMPLLQQIQPIMQWILSLPPLARVPAVPAARRALLHSAGVVSGTGTAGIFDHPGYNTTLTIVNSPSRQGVFHFKPRGNLSKFPVITPIVVSYLDIKQSFPQILDSPYVLPPARDRFGQIANESVLKFVPGYRELWEPSSWISDIPLFRMIASLSEPGYRVHSLCETAAGSQRCQHQCKSKIHTLIKKSHLATWRFLPLAGMEWSSGNLI